jgi:hypothetical protein
LPFDITYEWTLTDNETASYTISFPNSLSFYSNFTYYRILEAKGVDIANRKDTTIFWLLENKVYDYVGGKDDNLLYTDSEQGGVDNLFDVSYEKGSEYMTYTWKKKLITDDSCDMKIVEGESYRLVFYNGTIAEGERIEIHSADHYVYDIVFDEANVCVLQSQPSFLQLN